MASDGWDVVSTGAKGDGWDVVPTAPRQNPYVNVAALNPTERANYEATKGAGFAAPSDSNLSAGRIAATAAPAAAELGLTGGTGAVLAIPAAGAYAYGLLKGEGHETAKARANDVLQYVYQPKTDVGQGVLGTVGQVSQAPGEVYQAAAYGAGRAAQAAGVPVDPNDVAATAGKQAEGAALLAPLAPVAGGVASIARNPGAVASAVRGAARNFVDRLPDPEAAPADAQATLNRAAAASQQNMGAAAAAPSVSSANPALQRAITTTAQKTGGIVNPTAVQRHLQADRLGVQLMDGQATGDPVQLSEVMNLRGEQPEITERLNQQNTTLKGKLEDMRDLVAPDVHTTNAVEHGEALIDAYKAKDAALNSEIDQAYGAARKGVPTEASIMDAPQVLAEVTRNLHKELLFDSAPQDVMRTLGRLSDSDSLTFGNLENLRTNLARIMRSHTVDGNTKYAAGIIRDTLEQQPLNVANEAAKGLFDQARALAKSRFQMLEDDPAFKAAVYDKTPPDKFVQKYVIGGNSDDVATMAQNLADNVPARQTMSAAVIDHLRDRGGLTQDYNGTLRQASYNKALQALQPKMGSLVQPAAAERLSDIGDVLRYTQEQPAGNFVNNSNTLPAAMARAGMDFAAGAAGHSVAGPLGAIVARTGLKTLANKAGITPSAARARQALAVGSGLDHVTAQQSPAMQAMMTAARAKAAQEMALGAALKRTAHTAHLRDVAQNQNQLEPAA